MENLDLYRCKVCGNIIEVIHTGGGELVCCGEAMQKIIPQTHEEAINEKHVPIFVKKVNQEGEIRIGEVLHPMLEEHYIVFIQAISKDKNNVFLKYLYPGDEPKLHLNNIDFFNSAREFCNIHGLWEGHNN